MKCLVYNFNELKEYKYVVIFARYQDKWIVCKHKNLTTWQTAGGHIEAGEEPYDAAKRELYEETGALKFSMEPICDYWAGQESIKTNECQNGQVYFANVKELGKIPEDSEMEYIELFEEFPDNLTYPEITDALLPLVKSRV